MTAPDSDGVINVTQKIENFKEEQTLSIIMAAALYENDLLVDMKFEKADSIALEHTFDVDLTKPVTAGECKVHIMFLNGDTMVP